MKKSEKKDTIAIPVETVRKLKEFAESLGDQTLIAVKKLPEQKSMTAFLTEYARTGQVNVACGLAGLPKTTFYRYQRRNPEFRRRFLEIKEDFRQRAARERTKRMKQETAARLNDLMSLLSTVDRDEREDESEES